jgi:hypothetical protein
MNRLKALSVEIFGEASAYYDEVMASQSSAPASSPPASTAP